MFSVASGHEQGTGLPTLHVSGVAALVLEAEGGKLTPPQIRTILKQSADDRVKAGNDDFYGADRINALHAVLTRHSEGRECVRKTGRVLESWTQKGG